jgi:hypothetical protein
MNYPSDFCYFCDKNLKKLDPNLYSKGTFFCYACKHEYSIKIKDNKLYSVSFYIFDLNKTYKFSITEGKTLVKELIVIDMVALTEGENPMTISSVTVSAEWKINDSSFFDKENQEKIINKLQTFKCFK